MRILYTYSSNFMTALSELEVPIVHRDRSDEDAMFDVAKQCKKQGMNPEEAAVSYFVSEAKRGIETDLDKWRAMGIKAYRRVEIWSRHKKIAPQFVDMLFEFLQATDPDEA